MLEVSHFGTQEQSSVRAEIFKVNDADHLLQLLVEKAELAKATWKKPLRAILQVVRKGRQLRESPEYIAKRVRQLFSESEKKRKKKYLENIFNRADELNYGVYVIDSDSSRFVVIAGSQDQIQVYLPIIQKVGQYANVIDNNTIPGNCIYVHQKAVEAGLIDGSAGITADDRTYPDPHQKRAFPIHGIHQVGWKSLDEDSFLWVDLTAKKHLFEVNEGAAPLADALIVLQDLNQDAQPFHNLYQSGVDMDGW